MSRRFLLILCWLALLSGALAQNATDPNEGFRISALNQNGDYNVSWWGRTGRTYFLQYSEDLITWTYLPGFIEPGGAAVITTYLSPSGFDRFFFRLKYTDIPTSDPINGDFDGDKVSNEIETELSPERGTDPLHFADTDGDGMSDDWETRFGLDPHNPADAAVTADLDGDGISNLSEYQSGMFGTDPTNYYDSGLPAIQIISGNGQTAEPGNFSAAPLVLKLTFGATPVNNGPVTVYTDDAGSGLLSLTNDGTGLATVLQLHTGADGRVSVYFKHPSAIPATPTQRSIRARVGSAVPGGSSNTNSSSWAVSQTFYTYPSGTVGRNATEAIDSRIAGRNPATANDKLVFSTQNHNTSTYVRNTAAWCYDLRQQMTCISPWNSEGGVLEAGTAITAQHIINSAHFEIALGATVRFITAGNLVVERIIQGKATHPNAPGADLTVYTLDTPLPASITPCKLLPANYASYLSYLEQGRPPALVLDQEEKALVTELRALGNSAEFVKPGLHLNRLAFYEDLIPGDSGNPAFLIINNTLVLLTTITSGGAGSGTFVTPQISALNAMIVAADADATAHGYPSNTGLQVQTVYLGGFSTYTPPP